MHFYGCGTGGARVPTCVSSPLHSTELEMDIVGTELWLLHYWQNAAKGFVQSNQMQIYTFLLYAKKPKHFFKLY